MDGVEVSDVRRFERFEFAERHDAMLAGAEVALANLSLRGAQILHSQPLRIGTRARLVFAAPDRTVAIEAQVRWSQFAKLDAKLVYRSGLEIDEPDAAFAAAINALLKSGALGRDAGSLERKRERLIERERERAAAKTKIRSIPTSSPI